jgi:dinuclear metal center YbgI/SA1388 family protein
MAKIPLERVVAWCDRELRTTRIQDYDRAVNGLQVENRGTVSRIAAAVDASFKTVQMAIAQKADLLVVHHGLFWDERCPWTGRRYTLLRQLLDHNLAVYSSHLPLDLHPSLGNNAQLCDALGLKRRKPFFFDKNHHLGCQAHTRMTRDELAKRLGREVGRTPIVLPGGPPVCRRIGVVSGGAGSQMKLAAQEGVDTFITGEGPHWTFALAEELGLNVLYGGHYATETFGVKALVAALSKQFKLPWVFLDYPTGL